MNKKQSQEVILLNEINRKLDYIIEQCDKSVKNSKEVIKKSNKILYGALKQKEINFED